MNMHITAQLLPHLHSDVSLSIEDGQSVVITGENGIGKTTLLKHIAQKSDSVYVQQKPQDVFYDRSLETFHQLFVDHSGPSLNLLRFNKFWHSSGLVNKNERLLSQLSGGESQLLKLVTALSLDCSFYVLDEPTQSLDDSKKSLLREMLEEVTGRGAKVLIVEHDRSWLPSLWKTYILTQQDQTLKLDPSWNT
jgi:ABC-type multidrug transport system ATPase subunit